YHHPLMHIDLARGQANARRGIHSFKHIVDQRLELVVEVGNGGRDSSEALVGVFEDIKDRHEAVGLDNSDTYRLNPAKGLL
ncbi:MAG: accessory colonization factor AcfC, partial [Gammaproteobacteria bacterium]